MEKLGIYILGNDFVYDQLIALINSIEVNVSADIPICIIPYNERLDLVKQEVNNRKNLTLFENAESLQKWDTFAEEVWAAHSLAKQSKLSRNSLYKSPLLRKMAAFDGNFAKFVFYDADSLAMKPLDDLFSRLDRYDFIFDDWEHIKSQDDTALNLSLIEKSGLYQEEDIRPQLHCSSFFASKKGLFPATELEKFKTLLIDKKEIEWITRWWDDAFLFNYLTLRYELPLFNFTLSSDEQDRTGNCADADTFVNINHILYNQQDLKPIHRLHYMNYSTNEFVKLCKGEDVGICYQEEFLYYRFLKEPENRPQRLKKPSLASETNDYMKKMVNKVKMIISD
ncbi:MAG: Npun_R2821/Npun_R2822 family protein [Mastigocoleus sp.]